MGRLVKFFTLQYNIGRSINLTSRLTNPRLCGCVCVKRHYAQYQKNTSTDLLTSICRNIKFNGPISVAQFMREALTDQRKGYYIHEDMLGAHGDFVTSPELNQMFGEILAIWFITEWKALGSPKKFRFIELGPGRGTLADDILKTFNHFGSKIFGNVEMSFHFVEVSKKLSEIQYKTLCSPFENVEAMDECYQRGASKRGNLPIYWHRSLENIPNDQFTFFVAHEFFDALPIHKFIKNEKGWRELYIDIKPGTQDKLQFVQLPELTLATKLVKVEETRNHVEICPQAAAIANDMAKRIENNGGASLIVDYGHLGEKEDTLRSFKNHKLNDIFDNIGESDITADVDFSFLIDSTKPYEVTTSGPISQTDFLKNMGIDLRLVMLLKNCEDRKTAEKLVESYNIMVGKKHMGERFKFLALTSKERIDGSPVTGFYTESTK